MLNNVILANGSSVTWEEFSKWSAKRQAKSLCPYVHTADERIKISENRKGKRIGYTHSEETKAKIRKGMRHKMATPNGVFESKEATIEAISKDLNCTIKRANYLLRKWQKEFSNDYYIIRN